MRQIATRFIGPNSPRFGFGIDYLFEQAWNAATHSPDLSVQNGAVLVTRSGMLTRGHNDLTDGLPITPERLSRPLKYAVTEHAERNAVYDAARHGFTTRGGTMVALWAACADCARAIVQCGIQELIRHGYFTDASASEPQWLETIARGDEILTAGGVIITRYDDPIKTYGKPLRFAGKEINPW